MPIPARLMVPLHETCEEKAETPADSPEEGPFAPHTLCSLQSNLPSDLQTGTLQNGSVVLSQAPALHARGPWQPSLPGQAGRQVLADCPAPVLGLSSMPDIGPPGEVGV